MMSQIGGERSIKMKKVTHMVFLFFLLWGIVYTLNQEYARIVADDSTNDEELAKVNFLRPSFSLTGLDGKEYSTDDVTKPLVINFWASWCGPCKLEAPELVKLHKKYNKDIQIYAVNLTASDSIEGAKKFAENYGFEFPVLLDTDNLVSDKYNITAIPTTYFVNEEGVIVDQILGYGGKNVFEEKFKNLLN